MAVGQTISVVRRGLPKISDLINGDVYSLVCGRLKVVSHETAAPIYHDAIFDLNITQETN